MFKLRLPKRVASFHLLSLTTLTLMMLVGLLTPLLAVPGALAAPPAVTFTEYGVPTSGSKPHSITTGPDGNLWFTEYSGNKIGKMSTSGAFTEYSIPTGGSLPRYIVTGPDGNLWFAEQTGSNIARVTTAGTITEYPVLSGFGSQPTGITVGPDGNLWFTEQISNKIGKITTGGTVTEYSIPTASSNPWNITSGPDGNLWFTEGNGNKIGKITTAGVVSEFAVPTASSTPRDITSGPDGNLWFTENNANKIGKITTAGVISEYPVLTGGSKPWGITSGPDGNLWFAEFNANKIASITPAGVVTEYLIPSANSQPVDITIGPDGNLWFTELNSNKIGRIGLPPTITLSPTSLPKAIQGQSYSQTLSASGGTTPYTFALTGGSLPSGLSLASDGTLSGTPVASGTFSFTVTATDNNAFTGQQTYTLTVNPATPVGTSQADLAISLSSSTNTGGYGQQFTLTITITNNGPADASAVTAKISLPKGLGLLVSQPPSGTTFSPDSGDWSVGNIASGASISLALTLKVQDGGQLKVTAQITNLAEVDPNLDNNSATFIFNVTLPKIPAEVSAQLRVNPDRTLEAKEGAKLTLNLTARNIGPGQARMVYAKVPFDPTLLDPFASSFPDSRDWVKQVVKEGDTTYLEIRFHDLNIYEQVTGSVTFQVKEGVKPGMELKLRFTILWDDDTGVGRSRQSNLARLTFAEQGQNLNNGSVYNFDPAQLTVNRGESFSLKGDFFAPLEKVELWYTDKDNRSGSLGYTWADQEGKVNASFATADLPVGTYNISASGYYSQVQGTLLLTLKGDEPNRFDPAQANVRQGDGLQIEANCFSAGEKVTYWYAGVDGKSVELGYAWANEQGYVSIALDTAKFGPGEYTIMAYGNNSGIEAKMKLIVISKEFST